MSQAGARYFEKEKLQSPKTLGLVRNLGHKDLDLPCQTDVECIQSELWAYFWHKSSIECDAQWHKVKSQDISLTCLGLVQSIDRAY